MCRDTTGDEIASRSSAHSQQRIKGFPECKKDYNNDDVISVNTAELWLFYVIFFIRQKKERRRRKGIQQRRDEMRKLNSTRRKCRKVLHFSSCIINFSRAYQMPGIWSRGFLGERFSSNSKLFLKFLDQRDCFTVGSKHSGKVETFSIFRLLTQRWSLKHEQHAEFIKLFTTLRE